MLVAGNKDVDKFYSEKSNIGQAQMRHRSITQGFFIIENMLFDTSQARTDIDKIYIIAVESMSSVALIIWYPCAKV
jgi:hypothetical protein